MSRLAHWLRQEPALKLISLLVALVLWAWRSSESNPIETRQYTGLEVKVDSVAPGLAVIGTPPRVDLTLEGPRLILDQLERLEGPDPQDKVQPYVDLSEYRQPSWPTLPIQVRKPDEVKVLRQDPKEWPAQIDEVVALPKRISADTGGTTTPEGFVHATPEVSQTAGQVIGPRGAVGRVDRLVADVNLTGRTAAVTEQVKLRPVDRSGAPVRGVEVQPPKVRVQVAVARAEQSRMMPVAAPTVGRPSNGYVLRRTEVEPGRVLVSGTAEGLAKLGPAVTVAPVDLSGHTTGFGGTYPLVLPQGVAARPDRVRVRFVLTRGSE